MILIASKDLIKYQSSFIYNYLQCIYNNLQLIDIKLSNNDSNYHLCLKYLLKISILRIKKIIDEKNMDYHMTSIIKINDFLQKESTLVYDEDIPNDHMAMIIRNLLKKFNIFENF
jgi:hypothetical protein